MSLDSDFARFVSDEPAAIEQFRSFVGGELRHRLNLSPESLVALDEYVGNLTADPAWEANPLFEGLASIRAWLTVRIAYYLAAVARGAFKGVWRLEGDEPVLDLHDLHISPLEIASAFLRGEVDGGLAGLYTDLSTALAERSNAR